MNNLALIVGLLLYVGSTAKGSHPPEEKGVPMEDQSQQGDTTTTKISVKTGTIDSYKIRSVVTRQPEPLDIERLVPNPVEELNPLTTEFRFNNMSQVSLRCKVHRSRKSVVKRVWWSHSVAGKDITAVETYNDPDDQHNTISIYYRANRTSSSFVIQCLGERKNGVRDTRSITIFNSGSSITSCWLIIGSAVAIVLALRSSND